MALCHIQLSYVFTFSPFAGVSVILTASGLDFTCAVNSSGGLWCWGDNTYGQLGIESPLQQNSPVAVSLGNKTGEDTEVQTKDSKWIHFWCCHNILDHTLFESDWFANFCLFLL